MLEGVEQDDVSNIHRRWSFTQLSPTSFRQSFAGSLVCAALIAAVLHAYYLQSGAASLIPYLLIGVGIMAALHFVDYQALRGTPVNKLSKVAHVTLFANILWLLTVLLGMLSDALFSKGVSGLDYFAGGMLLAAGLRLGIFSSVFGASLWRAALASYIMPVIFMFAVIPVSAHPVLFTSYAGFGFGAVIYGLGAAWVIVADKAGRPFVKSTFVVLQAFLSAWTEKDPTRMEQLIQTRAHDEVVTTKTVRFDRTVDSSLAGVIVLPDVHPGPFGTVGGSNLPYMLYRHFSSSAVVMHSVSDHSLNIPSREEVERYLRGLAGSKQLERGDTCTVPAQVRDGKATSTAIAFGRTALVMLSLAPTGMEDVPQNVRHEIEMHGKKIGFSDVLVVDCHNAMGEQVGSQDEGSLVSAATKSLDELVGRAQLPFSIGFANLSDAGIKLATPELGESGIAVIAISVGGATYAIGWADSNNMNNTLREKILSNQGTATLLEVCTSDTHSTSGKRTREGYYALGDLGNADRIPSAFSKAAEEAARRASGPCSFEVATSSSDVKVMGSQVFKDYSAALDNSMRITKVFLGVTALVYVLFLVFS